jgi:hypothetical protein|tara:strand:+ start:2625 stop:3203 length:579 start_codon:yes stop_codon:yes gene_type:complete
LKQHDTKGVFVKGMIFTSFLYLVEERYGLEMVEEVIEEAAPASGGIYTTMGVYDHMELIDMVVVLSKKTDVPVPKVTKTFGMYLFAELIAAYPQWIEGMNSSFDMLQKVDSFIHVEVRKLYPDASPPAFKCSRYTDTTMELIYESPRCLGDVAEGLIQGCAAYYGEKLHVQRESLGDMSGSRERFFLTQVSD